MPDYPKLAQLWWKNVAVAVTGEKTPQQAMDNLANEMDDVMGRLQRAGMAHCAPKLNPKSAPAKWLSTKEAPWAKLRQREAQGRDDRLRHAAERVEGRQGPLIGCLLVRSAGRTLDAPVAAMSPGRYSSHRGRTSAVPDSRLRLQATP